MEFYVIEKSRVFKKRMLKSHVKLSQENPFLTWQGTPPELASFRYLVCKTYSYESHLREKRLLKKIFKFLKIYIFNFLLSFYNIKKSIGG